MIGFFGMVKRKKLSTPITDMIIDKCTSVSATQYSK